MGIGAYWVHIASCKGITCRSEHSHCSTASQDSCVLVFHSHTTSWHHDFGRNIVKALHLEKCGRQLHRHFQIAVLLTKYATLRRLCFGQDTCVLYLRAAIARFHVLVVYQLLVDHVAYRGRRSVGLTILEPVPMCISYGKLLR